jgi:tRNA U34 5-methylaminomethyl-2-thiouridine-forming methyltransferase MnmC
MPEPKKEQFDLVTLKSGHKSIRLSNTQQTFHPGIGPLAEANILHVQQQRLVERCSQVGKFVIWDVGFGASANAIVAIEALKNCVADVEIHSFEKSLDPIHFALENAEALQYLVPHQHSIRNLLEKKEIELSPNLKWKLQMGDFREQMNRTDIPRPHAIFYDPYSLSVNIEMWTLDFFTQLRKTLDNSIPCMLTNYTRSTVMRVTWLLAGFYVGVGATIGQKEETTIAANCLELLTHPLDRKWLDRVRASQSANPIRGTTQNIQPISDEDFEKLLTLDQFQHRAL